MWKKVMQQVHAKLENKDFDKPASGLTSVTVCMDSGLLATDACSMDLRGSRVHTVEVADGNGPHRILQSARD
jgi:penicillin-binding protein 1A